MEAKDAIDLNLIKTNMNLVSKDDALLELVILLKEKNIVSDIDGFINDIYLREKEGKTGIGNYVAIPHGKSQYVNRPAIAIGINNSEIPWETLDDKGVRVIVLFAVGNDSEASKEHLKVLSLFARKLGDNQVIEKLIHANDEKDVLSAFS